MSEVIFLLKSVSLNIVEVRQYNDRFTFDDDYDDACFVINKDTELWYIELSTQPKVIKFTSWLPMVGGSLRVLR
jgi:hypothetical protein